MEETVKQRLMIFIEAIGSNPSAFERQADLSNGYLNSLRNSPSPSKLEGILKAYPQLNKVWLLTGEGEMLNDSESIPVRSAPPSERSDVDRFLSIIEADHQLIREMVSKKDEEIDRLLAIMEADRGISYKKANVG